MSQVHIGNQSHFRQFRPDVELPLENRVFTKEYEHNRRQQGNDAQPADWDSDLNFQIDMHNELYFLRSCHLVLPLQARFFDSFGNGVRSPEEVANLAVRNRAERCFRRIESNLNGFRSHRDPDMMSYEQFMVTDDEYGRNLFSDGCGFPVNLGQTSCPSKCQGRTITPELSLAAAPKDLYRHR